MRMTCSTTSEEVQSAHSIQLLVIALIGKNQVINDPRPAGWVKFAARW